MNILLVVTGLPDAKSPARSVFNLRYAEELSRLGNNVTIVYLRAVKPGRSFLNTSKINEIDIYEVGILIPKIGFIKNPKPLSTLFSLLLKRKKLKNRLGEIDVIHAIHRNSIELAYTIGIKFGKPMISQFIGGNLNEDIAQLLRRKNFIEGVKYSSFLCFNSKQLKNVFLNEFGGDFSTRVLYRGVKLDDFPYKFIKSSVINILFLGGFPGNSNLKGGRTLIQAIKLLDSKTLSNPIKISIGGPNSLNFKKDLDAIQNKDIEIEFLGAIDNNLVRKKMSESHIVIIPSQFEGLPNVLYESMASGNMIIATDVGGISEVLENDTSGILIPSNDSEILMTSVMNAIQHIDNIEAYAKNGKEKMKTLSYSEFIKGYLNLYKQCLNN